MFLCPNIRLKIIKDTSVPCKHLTGLSQFGIKVTKEKTRVSKLSSFWFENPTSGDFCQKPASEWLIMRTCHIGRP